MWRYFLIVFCALILIWPEAAQAGSCKIINSTTLYLKGDTDEKMWTCIEKTDLSSIETVQLKSGGGRVKWALKIAERLAPIKARMIVKDRCHSSCANYFLPLARSVRVQPKAQILLHGSMDPGFARKHNHEQSWARVQAQDRFAKQHRIHRGWLMYREHYDQGRGGLLEYFDGEYGWPEEDGTIKYIQVEQKLFESCFPDIPIIFEKPNSSEQARSNDKQKQKFLKKGIRPSGSYICKGPFDPNEKPPSP